MLKKVLYISLGLTLFLACSKSNEIGSSDDVVIEEEFQQLYSCVSYENLLDPKTTNQDDLMQYWDKFVADVKCTRGQDFDEQLVSIKYFL